MKNDAFMEKAFKLTRYVVTGHWLVMNYTHKIPCYNPIIDRDKHIISIDGGAVVQDAGQLNAFMIQNNHFTYESADELPQYEVQKDQAESGGSINITWLDRFVEVVEEGAEFSLFRHLSSGKTISLPNDYIWRDEQGRLSCLGGTDYYLPVSVGETVSLFQRFGNKILAKKDGVLGWIQI